MENLSYSGKNQNDFAKAVIFLLGLALLREAFFPMRDNKGISGRKQDFYTGHAW